MGGSGYRGIGREFAKHGVVNHDEGEYVRRGTIHVNTAEAYFALLKRGIIGVYHHVSPQHLHRYLAEFDRRWNTRAVSDGDRAAVMVKAAQGKRLTYRPLVNKNTNGTTSYN